MDINATEEPNMCDSLTRAEAAGRARAAALLGVLLCGLLPPFAALAGTTEPGTESLMGLWPTAGLDIASAVFIGVLAALAAHSVLSHFLFRDRIFIAHALLALSLITAHLLLTAGIDPPLWLDGRTNSAELALPSAIALVALFASIFTRDFLDTRKSAPSYERLLLVTAALCIISLVAIWTLPPPYGAHAAWLSALLLAVVAISCGIGCLQLRVAGAGLFLAACGFVLIGQALSRTLSHGSWHVLGYHGAEAGLLIAVLLLSVAMTRRTDVARSTRAAQLAAELEASNLTLAVARETEAALLRRLEDRALEIDAANARLVERTRKMESLAHRDPLTKLPNRLLLEDRATHAITRAERHKSRVALLLLDIEAFRKVNQQHGRHTGDELLVLLAHRVSARLRAGDTVARIGGDEFAILLEDVFERDDLERVMEGFAEELAHPFTLGDKRISIEASMGFAFYPEDGEDPASLLRVADRRMLKVKQSRAGDGTTTT